MNIGRWRHSACVMQDGIFIMEGHNAEEEPVKEIERYDPSIDKWEVIARIDDKLIGHSLVVV